jgi:hypothetical protein
MAAQLAASQEGLSFVSEWVSEYIFLYTVQTVFLSFTSAFKHILKDSRVHFYFNFTILLTIVVIFIFYVIIEYCLHFGVLC